MYKIVWFRSDLRTIDNPALSSALLSDPTLPVRAIFVVTEQQWKRHDWGDNKIGFVLQSVLSLSAELNKLNIQLDILTCPDYKSILPEFLRYFSKIQISALYFNREYELNERKRDQTLVQELEKQKIVTFQYDCQTLIAPGVILTKQKTPYTVFTPFKRSCYEYLYEKDFRIISEPKSQTKLDIDNSSLKKFQVTYNKYLVNDILKLWPAGQKVAIKRLQDFCSSAIESYQKDRDFPALSGTSKLSAHLAVGSVSAKQCLVAALNANEHKIADGNSNITCWISELIWRDFYKQIIFHYPELCKNKNFNTKYDKLDWLSPEENLYFWQQGRTGVPIIDAAMRQLVTTGWMHNRLRMIVAMFLTKNLLIDWRHGEKFFNKHLIDLDFASNNGGWQWSASTGTDAVPYFRIFNPVTQSAKFDPDGVFIKQYCPELKNLNSKQIHDPSASLTSDELNILGYPKIIVNLNQSRARAIEYFKAL